MNQIFDLPRQPRGDMSKEEILLQLDIGWKMGLLLNIPSKCSGFEGKCRRVPFHYLPFVEEFLCGECAAIELKVKKMDNS